MSSNLRGHPTVWRRHDRRWEGPSTVSFVPRAALSPSIWQDLLSGEGAAPE